MIKVENLSYHYPHASEKELAVNDVSFHIQKGEWIAIVGHNGSGKSTMAKLLDGLLEASDGTIVIDGIPLTEQTIWEVRSKIGMVFQNPDNQFVGATVEDDVAFGLENQGLDREDMILRVQDALEQVDMLAFKDKEPSQLSGGQKQRVAIAGVLALRSDILILDEATAMLDPVGRDQVIRTLKALQQTYHLTILSITHDVEEAVLADRVFVMEKGKLILEKTPDELFDPNQDVSILGLDQPISYELLRLLKEEGVNVPPHYMSLEELEEWLCQYLFSK